jgi:hypothetical protein
MPFNRTAGGYRFAFSIHTSDMWSLAWTRQLQLEDKADERKISFSCRGRGIAFLRELRRAGRGRLRPGGASGRVWLLPTQRGGRRARPGSGCAGSLWARTSLAPGPTSLLGVVTIARC